MASNIGTTVHDNLEMKHVDEMNESQTSGIAKFAHVYKGKSVNSSRLRNILSESVVHMDDLTPRAAIRAKKKEELFEKATINTIPSKGTVIWDGVTEVYMDGSGCGLLEHVSGGCQILDARMAELVIQCDFGAVVKDVLCLLPRAETQGIFGKGSFDAFVSLERAARPTTQLRGVKRRALGTEKYVTVGTKACRNARGLMDGMHLLRSLPHAHKEMSRILRQIERRCAKWIRTLDLKAVGKAKELGKYPGFSYSGKDGESQIWPSLACGRNTFLPLHTDMDYFLSAVAVHTNRQTGNVVLQYFCFPTLGITVALRNGDVLLFNPTIPHCISSPTSDRYEVFSMSAYLKSLVVSGNSNLQPGHIT
jgi:hypothetical protein